MSYTEFHKGKFKIIAKNDVDIIEYAKQNNKDNWDLDVDENGKLDDPYCSDDEYSILTLNRYKDNERHVLIKYIEREEKEGSEYINEFKQIGKDEFEFVCQFYNGGTCEHEIFEENLEKIDLDIPIKEEDTISIRISKDYDWKMMMYESDLRRIRQGDHFTVPSDYNPEWENVKVTKDELFDYIKSRYAIKINC